jgi:hypothetical protein
VSTNGGSAPHWSRDGKELFYDGGDFMMAVPVKSGTNFEMGTPVRLFSTTASVSGGGGGSFYDVAADGRFLVNLLVERTSPPAVVILDWLSGLTPAP